MSPIRMMPDQPLRPGRRVEPGMKKSSRAICHKGTEKGPHCPLSKIESSVAIGAACSTDFCDTPRICVDNGIDEPYSE
jgi:hypothetical protein